MPDDLKCVCLDGHSLHFSQQDIAGRVRFNSLTECSHLSPHKHTDNLLTVALQAMHLSLSSLPRPCKEAIMNCIRLKMKEENRTQVNQDQSMFESIIKKLK